MFQNSAKATIKLVDCLCFISKTVIIVLASRVRRAVQTRKLFCSQDLLNGPETIRTSDLVLIRDAL